MKTVRTQEESLDQLRNRRKGVASKADAAERKLNRMDSGHKDTAAQSALLEGLRNSIRELDSEIMTGEAKLGDLKRALAKVWMALKFGGLQECCRKGIVRFCRHVYSSLLMDIFRLSLMQESSSWPSFLS
jgi:predicted RNase H-like nuclease (RuvC/YqgF family)